MFRELANAFTGSLSGAAYTNPPPGINVSRGAKFKNFFKSFAASLSGYSQFGGAPGIPGAYAGGPGFLGSAPNAPRVKNINRIRNQRAMSPGSVINFIPNNNAQGQRGQIKNQQAFGQNSFGLSPIQGFAGQTGTINPAFGAPGQFPAGPIQGQFGPGFAAQAGSARGGVLPMLIMPIVSLFTLVGSLFRIKKLIGSFQPVQVEKPTALNDYNNYLDELYASRGSFDPMPEFELKQKPLEEDFDYTTIQGF